MARPGIDKGNLPGGSASNRQDYDASRGPGYYQPSTFGTPLQSGYMLGTGSSFAPAPPEVQAMYARESNNKLNQRYDALANAPNQMWRADLLKEILSRVPYPARQQAAILRTQTGSAAQPTYDDQGRRRK